MAKSGRFWIEGASEYSTEDCNDISDVVVNSLNQYLNTMRVDDYKYLAEQDGLDYFRDAMQTGSVVVKYKEIEKFLKNLKNKDEIKIKVHEVVEDMKGLAINFSDKCKRNRKENNVNANN